VGYGLAEQAVALVGGGERVAAAWSALPSMTAAVAPRMAIPNRPERDSAGSASGA